MGIVTHMMYSELSNNNNNNDEPEKKTKKGRHHRGKTSRLCNCKLLSFLIMKVPLIPIRKTVFFFIFTVGPVSCVIAISCSCMSLF